MSACLLGVRCRYDGASCESAEALLYLSGILAIPICPEQLGGLPTPRSPCRLEGGSGADVIAGRAGTSGSAGARRTGRSRVVDEDGADRTDEFLRGADEALGLARVFGARRAILKAGSPSCDAASGVAAARLREAGIEIESVD